MGTGPASLRLLLRDATARLHAQIDAASAHLDLRVRGDYARFLVAQAAALLPLEALVERQNGGSLRDWPRRRRTAAMLGDLRLLGVRAPSEVAVRLVDHPAWIMGVLYVLEGSRLGGKILLRRVLDGDDADCRAATAYLSQGAAQNLWPSFLLQLEASIEARGDPEMLVSGARDAFAAFEAADRLVSSTFVMSARRMGWVGR